MFERLRKLLLADKPKDPSQETDANTRKDPVKFTREILDIMRIKGPKDPEAAKPPRHKPPT